MLRRALPWTFDAQLFGDVEAGGERIFVEAVPTIAAAEIGKTGKKLDLKEIDQVIAKRFQDQWNKYIKSKIDQGLEHQLPGYSGLTAEHVLLEIATPIANSVNDLLNSVPFFPLGYPDTPASNTENPVKLAAKARENRLSEQAALILSLEDILSKLNDNPDTSMGVNLDNKSISDNKLVSDNMDISF